MKSMKKHVMQLVVVCMVLTIFPMPSAAAGKTATPTTSTVYVDGERVSFTAYNIDGYNYFSLRDLAAALNGTGKQFSVGWDNNTRTITLETGKAYTSVGGELSVSTSKANRTAVPTTGSLFCNDVNLVYTAYNIGGNNYFKLRDIMQIMDIGVAWDGALNSISIDTGRQYVYDNGVLRGTALPELRIKGNWPVSEKSLQTSWAKCYPLYATYLGLPTKILTEGVTWEWDDSIVPDTVGYYAETNSFKMGPLPHHRNFDPNNHEDYEPLYMQNMHETGHLFWQVGDRNLAFDFGQWIWEATALVGEALYKMDYYGEGIPLDRYDLKANLGHDVVNGVMNDGNKYGGGGRTMVDGSATEALMMLASVISHDSCYDYFARVNAQRVNYYEETGIVDVPAGAYGEMLDKAANGRAIDGMKPSEWLYSQPVANTDGALGTYLTIVPMHPCLDSGLVRHGQLDIETALYRRIIDENGDKKEEAIVGTSVDMRLYDGTGRLLTQTTRPSPTGNHGAIEMPVPSSMVPGAYRIAAEAVVDGKTVTATSYVIYQNRNLADNQMAFILLNDDGTIRTDVGGSLKITGERSADTSAVARGLVVLTADEGASVTVQCGDFFRTISKPAGSRIVPLRIG